MTRSSDTPNRNSTHTRSWLTDALVTSIWVGLGTGLLEAIITYATRFAPAISPYRKAGVEIFWLAPLAYTLVFSLLGVFLAVAARLFLKRQSALLVLGVLSMLGFFTALGYPKVIQTMGILALSVGGATVLYRAVRKHEQASLAFLRRYLLHAVLAVAVIAGGATGLLALRERIAVSQLPAAAPQAPNVLIIIIDAMRGDRLSSAGYERQTTPNLDAFGREGVQYDYAFSTAPWTMPSHNTFLTGRYTYEHRMDYPVPYLKHGYPYLPQVLARQGYRSGFFSANVGPGTQEYLDAGFHDYDTYTVESTLTRMSFFRKFVWQLEDRAGIRLPRSKRAPQITGAFLEWADRIPGRPFFALLNYIDVHDHFRWEWGTPPPYDTRFGDAHPRRIRRNRYDDKAKVDLYYDAAVAYEDNQIGILLAELQRRGLDKNTLVLITSDHGEGLLQHGHLAHASSLYFEQLHVPLLIRFPGKVAAGERVSRPVSLVELPATILKLLALPLVLPGMPLPLTKAEADTTIEEPLLAEFNTVEVAPLLKSLLTSHWHYIRDFHTGEEQLYDWNADVGETRNLIQTEEGRRIASEFAKQLKEFLGRPRAVGSEPSASNRAGKQKTNARFRGSLN